MRLSVIVCTRNRAPILSVCLNSVARAFANAEIADGEIVVVDNGSTDDTSAQITKWLATAPCNVQSIVEPRKGLSVARNRGIRAAKGDLLVFIDDDCRMTDTYVQELLRYDAADTEPVLRGGAVKLGDATDLPLTTITEPQTKRWHINDRVTRSENLGNAILGCNIALRRNVMDRIGFYDEKLGPGTPLHAGEDPDIVFRAYLLGIAIVYVPDMAVIHFHGRKTVEQGTQLLKNYSLGGGAIYAKYLFRHPDFCRQYYWDLKGVVREIMERKSSYMPNFGFSHKKKIFYNTLGAAMYAGAALRALLAGNRAA